MKYLNSSECECGWSQFVNLAIPSCSECLNFFNPVCRKTWQLRIEYFVDLEVVTQLNHIFYENSFLYII